MHRQALLWHEPNLVESTLFKNRIDVLHLACMVGAGSPGCHVLSLTLDNDAVWSSGGGQLPYRTGLQ